MMNQVLTQSSNNTQNSRSFIQDNVKIIRYKKNTSSYLHLHTSYKRLQERWLLT